MDAEERLFADIAVRLQLLTREQIGRCVQQTEHASGKRLGEIAVELGLISDDEVELVRAQQARVLERQRGAQHGSGPSAPEPRMPRPDPRADDAPTRPEPPARRRRAPREWEAATNPVHGAIHVPQTPGAAVAPSHTPTLRPLSNAPATEARAAASAELDGPPTGTHARLPPREPPRAPNAAPPPPPPPPPRPPAATADLSAFPLAEGADAAKLSELPQAPPAPPAPPAPAARPVLGAAGGTVLQPFVAPAPAPSAQAAVPAAAGSPDDTLVQPFAAPPAPAAHNPSQPPPKAAQRRPAGAVAATDSYLGKALALALRQGASDLHAHSGAPLLVRVDGQVRPLSSQQLLSAEAAEKVIAEIASDAQWMLLAKHGEVDFAWEIPGLARFRVNVYRQQRGLDAVFRIIPLQPPTLEQLGLPARLASLTDFRTGMVLCTGPTGCGKSTTLAALLGGLIESRDEHVLTIEDPVEHVYPPGRALVNQRQVRDHTSSFARALRAALREDPDVIAITELRDRETIGLAISAAETGHLVLGTLHTGSASQTIQRIVSSFPADEQEQVRSMLSESLRAVVSQRLVPAASGKGRIPALELLMVTTAVSNMIREDKTHQLPSVMQTGRAAGMITLDDSLEQLVRAGSVTAESARRFALRKERFA